MDISDQTLQVRVAGAKKRRRTVRERGEIVEETLLPGASGVESGEATQRQREPGVLLPELYREGQLGGRTDTQLVPVKVAND